MIGFPRSIEHGRTIGALSSMAALLGTVTIAGIGLIARPSRSAAQGLALPNSLSLPAVGMSLRYPEGWSVAPKRYANMDELIDVPAARQDMEEATARILIGTQTRTDHAEAIREPQDIAAEAGSPATFLAIGGWPALQRRHLGRRPQPSRGPQFADEMELRLTTAVAAGNQLVRLEASLPSDADRALIDQVEAIGRSLVFTTPGGPGQVQQELEYLRSRLGPQDSHLAPPPPEGSAATPELALRVRGTRRVLAGGNGELEIALSPDGQNIVLGRQSAFVTSNDGGRTFPFSGFIAAFNQGDPSLAFGQSGNFYYAGINGEGRGLCPVGSTCTGIARSTDNGRTFPVIAAAVVCPNTGPGDCFPDQEHIAADRVNAAPAGDQVYSGWRNFPLPFPSFPTPSIVCSQDSGVTWTAPLGIEAGGDFPRVTVGQDGIVYVIYRVGGNIRLHQYSSCSTGLTAQPGFPLTVTAVTDVTCPVPGLDRCNDGNLLSSHMVAVDDTNADHIYVAYAHNTAAGDENILVRDSVNGGVNWSPPVPVNGSALGRRFMPWVCTTGGKAVVTWCDRRAADVALNDLTDYFGASAFNVLGNLTAGTEFKITRVTDPQCDSGWPCGTRNMADSESCSVQPQLAGFCLNPATGGGSFNRCDFSDTPGVGIPPCLAGEICSRSRGCPKYGDYNGNACAAGRLFTAWASATPPIGPGSTGISIFFSAFFLVDPLLAGP